jgi:hypothetical protein
VNVRVRNFADQARPLALAVRPADRARLADPDVQYAQIAQQR